MPENRIAIIQMNQGLKSIVFRSTVAKFIFVARKKTRWSSGSRCSNPLENEKLKKKTITTKDDFESVKLEAEDFEFRKVDFDQKFGKQIFWWDRKKFPKKMGLENPSYQEEEAEEAFEMEVSDLERFFG